MVQSLPAEPELSPQGGREAHGLTFRSQARGLQRGFSLHLGARQSHEDLDPFKISCIFCSALLCIVQSLSWTNFEKFSYWEIRGNRVASVQLCRNKEKHRSPLWKLCLMGSRHTGTSSRGWELWMHLLFVLWILTRAWKATHNHTFSYCCWETARLRGTDEAFEQLHMRWKYVLLPNEFWAIMKKNESIRSFDLGLPDRRL